MAQKFKSVDKAIVNFELVKELKKIDSSVDFGLNILAGNKHTKSVRRILQLVEHLKKAGSNRSGVSPYTDRDGKIESKELREFVQNIPQIELDRLSKIIDVSPAVNKEGNLDLTQLCMVNTFQPSSITLSLSPIKESFPMKDRHWPVKEKWLLEKYYLDKQLQKQKVKADLVQKVLSVGREMQNQDRIKMKKQITSGLKAPADKKLTLRTNSKGILSYANKTRDKDFKYRIFNEQIQKLNDLKK